MNLTAVKNAATAKVGRQILISQKHSPTLLFVGGVAGVMATTLLACRATLKLDQILDESDADHDKVRTLEHIKYSELDRKKDHAIIMVRTTVKITKLYAPAVGVGVLSVAALTGSHVVLKRRNVAITAAYAALDKGFREYRKRVIDDVGAEKDQQYRYGSEIRELVEDTEKGAKVRAVTTVAPGDPSIYARFFDETSKSWQPHADYNRAYLRAQQNYFNDMLRARGHVFLNEVYDALGLERSKAGACVGWVLGKGDNFIDFGVFDDEKNWHVRDFVNGRERSILLDFNVDGSILDLI